MTYADVIDCCNADARTNVLAQGMYEDIMKCSWITVQDAINMEMSERFWEKRGSSPMEEWGIEQRIRLGQGE